MINNNSLTLFDQLATEIIFEIFEYLSCSDIIYTFFHFNQRLNSILLQHQQFLNNLETPTGDFYFWENVFSIIGSQIQCLIITTLDFCFTLNLFPNLKSIIISSSFSIDYNRLHSILKSEQFNKLNSFKIKRKICCSTLYIGELLFKNIFRINNSLKIFEYLPELSLSNSREIDNLTVNINIHSLSLKLTSFIDALSLLRHTPNLKYLNLIVTSFDQRYRLKNELTLSKIQLEKFHFTCERDRRYQFIYEEDFLSLTYFIKQFSSSLISLSINLSQKCIIESNIFHFNGILFEKQLLESMVQLKKFYLYAKFDQQPFFIENLLSTFENQFWFDHNWSIGMHGQYLYTLPFHFDKLDGVIDFNDVKSNNSMICNSPQTWYYVKSIDFRGWFKLNLRLIKEIKIKMPNLISITLTSFSDQSFNITNASDTMNTTLDSVATVYFRGNLTKCFQQWLINILPNFKHLVLYHTPDFIPIVYEKIEKLNIFDADIRDGWIKTINVYFPNVKHVEIEVYNYDQHDVMKILKSFKNFKTLILNFGYGYSRIKERTDLSEMFDKFGSIEILQNYQIKYGYSCLQLLKKTNE